MAIGRGIHRPHREAAAALQGPGKARLRSDRQPVAAARPRGARPAACYSNASTALRLARFIGLPSIGLIGAWRIPSTGNTEHRAVFRVSEQESRLLLERLYHQCLLDKDPNAVEPTYRLVPLYSDVVTRYLSNANFLY